MPTVWDFRSCISSEAVWAEVHEGHMPTLPSDGTRFSRRFSRKGLPQSGNLQNSAAASALQCVTLNCVVRAILWEHSSTGIWNRSVTICTSSFLMRQWARKRASRMSQKTSTVLLIFRLTLIFPKAMLKVLHFVLMFTAELPISAVTRTQTMLLTSCRTDSARFRTRFSDLSTLPLCVTRLTQWVFTKSDRTAQRSCSL